MAKCEYCSKELFVNDEYYVYWCVDCTEDHIDLLDNAGLTYHLTAEGIMMYGAGYQYWSDKKNMDKVRALTKIKLGQADQEPEQQFLEIEPPAQPEVCQLHYYGIGKCSCYLRVPDTLQANTDIFGYFYDKRK